MADDTTPKPPPRKRNAKAPEIASVTPITKPRRRPDGRARGGPAPASPKALSVNERRERVMNLSRMGFNGPQIAQRISEQFNLPSYTKADVYKDRATYMADVHVEVATDYLDYQLDLLRTAQTVAMSMMLNVNQTPAVRLEALRCVLRVQDQGARFVGGYAPVKHALTDPQGNAVPWLNPTDDPTIIQGEAMRVLDEILPLLPPADETGATSS